MKNKKKFSIDIMLLVILILCLIELGSYITFKAGFFYQFIDRCRMDRYAFLFEIINNLSMTYIMSYIFYLLVLIPEKRKQQSINKYVRVYLGNIIRLLEQVIKVSKSLKDEKKALTDSPKLFHAKQSSEGYQPFLTYREHFVDFYRAFQTEYQHLSHYIAFIDNDLRDCLYQIVTSDFMTQIKELLVDENSSVLDAAFVHKIDDTAIADLCTTLKCVEAQGGMRG